MAGSQEDVRLWAGGMFFLLSIVLSCPLCGPRAGRQHVAWQALCRARGRFRRELTRCERLELFTRCGRALDWLRKGWEMAHSWQL